MPDSPAIIRLALHTFCYEQHFLHKPGFDVHAFLARATERAMAGVHISLNGYRFRCAGSTDPERLREIGADAQDRGFFVECDTSGTDPDHLAQLARAARQLGADRIRTYTRHTGTPQAVKQATVRDLKAAAPSMLDEGVTLLLENHEDFTGMEVTEIIDAVDHPGVAALYDFGNSMNVAEEPMNAARAMARHIRSVHLKDHAIITSPSGEKMISGVPNGAGSIPISEILAFLIDTTGLERLCIESSFGYVSKVTRNKAAFEAACQNSPSFEPLNPPYSQATVLPNAEDLRRADPDLLFDLEEASVTRSVAHAREVLRGLGFNAQLNGRGGIYHRGKRELAMAERHL